MPESFDQKITRKFRSVFEGYNEPFNESAWNLMKQKLANKKKRRIIWLINIAKAASVVLFIGISVLLPHKTNNRHAFNNNNIERNEHSINKAKNLTEETEGNVLKDTNTILNKNKVYTENKKINNEKLNHNNIVENTEKINIANDSSDIRNKNNSIYAENSFYNLTDTSNSINKADSSGITDKRPILGPDDSNYFLKKRSEKKFNFGIAVSSHYSSSDIGAKDNINIGGGFLTEYMISDKISINSGLLLANHNLNTASSSVLGGIYKADAMDNSFAGSSEKEVLLVGLDIPLNVKLNFDKIYISTGVSSLIYLKESYSESFYVENTQEVYDSETSSYETLYIYDKVNETDERGAFQTFDFAKLFNLSVGYKIPLKTGSLTFEPFAKIPIGKLTGYNISYGYGGLALKYDF